MNQRLTRPEIIKLLEENIGKNSLKLVLNTDFPGYDITSTTARENINK